MKVKVNRRLSAGFYYVSFDVGDFTPDEVQKMGSFGVPQITLRWGGGGPGLASGQIALNQISAKLSAGFQTEDQARKYEEEVLAQIRKEVARLRERQDKFSSSEEVAL